MTKHEFPTHVTLKKGSHELPSDGSCAMEVAVLAAGYEWKEIKSPSDLPVCMCRVLGAYTIALNDAMPDEPRQQLMQYVACMSGTAATPQIQQERAEYLVWHAAKPAAIAALKAVNMPENYIQAIEQTTTLKQLAAAIYAARDAAAIYAARDAAAIYAAAFAAAFAAADAADAADADAATRAAHAATRAAFAAAFAAADADVPFDWQPYLDALKGALDIGPSGTRPEPSTLKQRTEILKQHANIRQ